jgi:hypothetical protein
MARSRARSYGCSMCDEAGDRDGDRALKFQVEVEAVDLCLGTDDLRLSVSKSFEARTKSTYTTTTTYIY